MATYGPLNLIHRSPPLTLTDAQIKALPTTGVEVVAAPGVGKRILLVVGQAVLDNTAGVYTNVHTDMGLALKTGAAFVSAQNLAEWMFTDGSDKAVMELPPAIIASGATFGGNGDLAAEYDNQPLILRMQNTGMGDLTGGNAANTLTVTAFYAIVDV